MPEGDHIADAGTDLHIVIGQLLRRLRRETTLPIPHTAVLNRLEREGPKTTSALALAEGVRPQSMAQTLAELEKEGLISRRPDENDRRQVFVELTSRGLETLLDDRRRRAAWLEQAIAARLTSRERRVLVEALELLRRIAAT